MALRTPAVVVALAAVLVGGCSGAEPDEPAVTRAPEATTPAPDATLPPGISDSAQLSEPVAAHGVITRPDGAPVAGALVQLVTESASGPDGPVAAARTSADGRYELRIAADVRAALPVDDAGQIGFAVTVDSPDGVARTSWTGPGELTHPHTADLELDPGG